MKKIYIDTSQSYLLPKAGFDANRRFLEYKKKLNDYKFFSILKDHGPKAKSIKNILDQFKIAEEKQHGVQLSGLLPVKVLCDEIEKVLKDEQDRIFAVVSNNSAHHFSYPLSNIAFSKHGKNANKKIIINFDQHEDKGGASANEVKKDDAIIACSAWGQFALFRERNNAKADEYVVIGWGTRGQSKNTIYKSGGSVDFAKGQVIEKIKKYNSDQYDVYITVDRDFADGGKTKYNYSRTPEYKQEDGRKLVTEVIENLGSANIVGFDVTGLPACENNAETYQIDAAAFNTALQDIEAYQTKVEDVLN